MATPFMYPPGTETSIDLISAEETDISSSIESAKAPPGATEAEPGAGDPDSCADSCRAADAGTRDPCGG